MPAIASTAPETLLSDPRDILQKSLYPTQILSKPAMRSEMCMNAFEGVTFAHRAPIG
jgi:hypothetical protein